MNVSMDNDTISGNGSSCPPAITADDKQFVVPALLVLVCLIGIVGNSGVIYVVYRFRRMNPLFLNLAVADLLFNLFCLPVHSAFFATKHQILIGNFTCKAVYYLTYVTMGVSIYSLVAICVLRYFGIRYPLHLKTTLCRRTSYKAAGVTWLVMLLLNIPLTIIMEEQDERRCALHNGGAHMYIIYVAVVSGVDFILPAVTIAILSTFIIVHVFQIKEEQRRLTEFEKGGYHRASKRATKRLMLLVVLVFSLFIVCWAPMHVLFLRAVVNRSMEDHRSCILKQVTEYIFLIAQMLAFCNSSINPIVYNFVSEEFRLVFARALCPFLNRKTNEEQSEVTRRITVSFRTETDVDTSEAGYQTMPLRTISLLNRYNNRQ